MTPNELESVAKAMGAMFQCFPQSVLADPDLQVRGYVMAVKDYEAVDVLAACQRFIQGDVPDHNKAFCPSSAQLCYEVRQRREMRGIMAKREARLSLVKG
jgi:hypothetical protein